MNNDSRTIKASKGSSGNRTLFFCVFLLALLFALGFEIRADSSFPKEARFSERIFGLKGLTNVGRVAPNVYRGAQPLPEGYVTLKKMGIRTVINLRITSSSFRNRRRK